MIPRDLPVEWRKLAALFRDKAVESVARAYEDCADQLEASLSEENDTLLTLPAAAAESGYSADHLGRMVRDGKIPNGGRPHAPRIARRDLPRKARVASLGEIPQLSREQIVLSIIEEGVS